MGLLDVLKGILLLLPLLVLLLLLLLLLLVLRLFFWSSLTCATSTYTTSISGTTSTDSYCYCYCYRYFHCYCYSNSYCYCYSYSYSYYYSYYYSSSYSSSSDVLLSSVGDITYLFFRYFDIEIQSCLFHQDIAPERTGLSKFQHLWWIGLAWIWKVRSKCSKLGECVVVESSTSATKQHGISAR